MTEWKWEDAASRSPPSSVKRRSENVASAPAEYIKGGGPHSHIRTSAETLGFAEENRAPTLAPRSHHAGTAPASSQRKRTPHDGVPDSECCANVVREKTPSFAREPPEFLPLCECASVSPNLLCITSPPASGAAIPSEDSPTTSAAVIAPRRWVEVVAGANKPSFEQPCPERRGLVERRGHLFLHFCTECGRWGAYGYGCTGDNPGRWYCWLHRPGE